MLYILILLLTMCSYSLSISSDELQEIGKKIWQNECAGSITGLTSWNAGEDCASMGIGHFIWYPKNKKTEFHETFPDLLRFMESQGKKIPQFIKKDPNLYCPWNSREEFLLALKSPEILELQQFLVDTIDLQVKFIENRFNNTMSDNNFNHVKKQFLRVKESPNGLYVLMDYINFKGEGISPQERYNNVGWGLLQVLEAMHGTSPGAPAVKEFADSAQMVLERRIKNAPPERHEERWLAGWKNRIKTYYSCSSQ